MFTKKKNKYCCFWFSIFHQHPSTSNCIRIIKFVNFPVKLLKVEYAAGESGEQRFIKDSNIPYRFFFMDPAPPSNLRENYNKGIRGYNLSYCPWCGVNLYAFYANERNIEDYVNEIEGETFS